MNQHTAERPPAPTREDAPVETPVDTSGDDLIGTSQPGINLDESPLAWLARRKDKDGKPMLSEFELAAGEKLRADFWFAQMTPNVTANWSMLKSEGGGRRGSPDHGAELADHVIAAQERVRLALKAAGPDLAGLLIDVCCFLKGLEVIERSCRWPQRSGKIVLQIALRQLARHYGLISDSSRPRAAGRVTHWGSDDYRPRPDGK
jgi:Domain of unknown function (DUF6456)